MKHSGNNTNILGWQENIELELHKLSLIFLTQEVVVDSISIHKTVLKM
jgi:hypothetical protein